MAARPLPDPSAEALLDLVASHRITASICVAARLGVADCLADGPKTSQELAQRTGAHQPSLHRLLRALVTLGICEPVEREQFALTAVGAYLVGDAEQSLKDWVLFEGGMLWLSWNGLFDSIRTGKNTAQLAGLDNAFELLAQNPNSIMTFNRAMAALTRQLTPAVLAAYDFSRIAKLIDVGGGHGQLLCAILRAYPSMRGAVFDLPRCADGANQQLRAAGVSDRGEFIAGSFFESVPPGADAVILKSIIHDWNDERSLTILHNCRRALAVGGTLLVVERLMPEMLAANPQHSAVTLSDLNMLRGLGGCERTEREYADLLRQSGFRVGRVLPAGSWSLIEATAG